MLRTDCFDLVQNLFGSNLRMISFDGADWGTNSDVLVSFLLDVGTFAERLFLYCFDITSLYHTKQVHIRVHPSVHMYIIHYSLFD
jgi:hypothetical protein